MKTCVCLRNFSFGDRLLLRIRVPSSILVETSFRRFMGVWIFSSVASFVYVSEVEAHAFWTSVAKLFGVGVNKYYNIAHASWKTIRYRPSQILDKRVKYLRSGDLWTVGRWYSITLLLFPYFLPLLHILLLLILLLLLSIFSSLSSPHIPLTLPIFFFHVNFIFLLSSSSSFSPFFFSFVFSA
jgi:hypothetical protein